LQFSDCAHSSFSSWWLYSTSLTSITYYFALLHKFSFMSHTHGLTQPSFRESSVLCLMSNSPHQSLCCLSYSHHHFFLNWFLYHLWK
jgi:hypothetical protein